MVDKGSQQSSTTNKTSFNFYTYFEERMEKIEIE